MISVILLALVTTLSIGAALLDYRAYGSPLRTILIIVSGAALMGYILETDPASEQSGPVILLTDGVMINDYPLRSEAEVFSLESAQNPHPDRIRWLSSVDLLADVVEPGRVVEIFGNGTRERLTSEFLWVDHLQEPSPGLVLDRAPRQVDTGKDFQITGRLITKSEIDTVSLYRDGDRILSHMTGRDGSFTFTDRLRVEGPALYHIEAETADTLLREPWHVRATEPDRLSVGVMLYSPSFEITHLAEWLGNNGHRLAMRTRIGNDRFRFDEINEPPSAAPDIMDNLSSFDFLILDHREAGEWSEDQIQLVRRAVENGLDVMLLPPSDGAERGWEEVITSISGKGIELEMVSRIEERQWLPDISTSIRENEPLDSRLPLLNYNYAEIGNGTEISGRFENRDPVIVRVFTGSGSVTSHLFYQTYSWKLRGDSDIYARFWAEYLDSAITLESPFVEVGSVVPGIADRLTLTTSGRRLAVRQPAQNQQWEIPLTSGAEHPGVSYGYFWPRSTGWHVAESGETRRWFYVYESDWSFSERYRRFRATQQEIQNLSSGQGGNAGTGTDRLSARWWLIGFLTLQMILWAERKVLG